MRFDVTLMLLLSILLSPDRSNAQDPSPSEYQVKAAFLFNFAKFVQWPEQAFSDSKSPLFFGVLGDDPFGGYLERAIREKVLNGRSLTVKACRTLEEARHCHVLFISASEKTRLKGIFDELGGMHILTVGDTPNFLENGGMISFFRDGKRIRFEIKDETARKAGLKIDSKLLGLAKTPTG